MDHIYTKREYWLARGHGDGLDHLPRFYHDCPGIEASGHYPVIATLSAERDEFLPLATILQACLGAEEIHDGPSSSWGLDTTGQEYSPIPITYCPFCGVLLPDMASNTDTSEDV